MHPISFREMQSFLTIFGLVFFALLVFVHAQRPPHPRPPPDQMNYDCLVDEDTPKYVPLLDRKTTRSVYVPQSDTTYWVMLRWLKGLSQFYPNLIINATIVGSGIAGPCLTNATCDFSVVGREVLLQEEAPFIEKFGYPLFEYPVAGGSVAALAYTDTLTVMVHPSNPLKQITFAQFDAVFSSTRNRRFPFDITTWDQLGLKGDWVGKPIHMYGVEAPNGFELFFNRTALLGGKWKSSIVTQPTVFQLATEVSEDRYSFGYTGLAFLNATVNQLSLIQDSGWPFVQLSTAKAYGPSKENICSRDYPLSRLIYCYAHKKPNQPLDPVVLEFLNYILSYEGQKDVQDDMVFLPLPASVVVQLREQLGLPINRSFSN